MVRRCHANLNCDAKSGSPGSGSCCRRGSPRPERFVSEDAERVAGREMALDVERVVDRTALPWSRGSSRHRLAAYLGRTPQSLRSSSITELSSLLRTAPSLCPASVLGLLRGPPA